MFILPYSIIGTCKNSLKERLPSQYTTTSKNQGASSPVWVVTRAGFEPARIGAMVPVVSRSKNVLVNSCHAPLYLDTKTCAILSAPTNSATS